MEDFNKLRLLARQMNRTDFRHGWQFRIEVTSAHSQDPPSDFDIYVKDVTYDPIEIETETEKLAGHTFTWPVGAAPVTVSMTMRDNIDQRIRKWFQGMTDIIILPDGTVEMIKKVEVEVARYALAPDGTDVGEPEILWMIPTKLGGITESRDDGNNIEFPITFVQHRTTENT